MILRKEINQRIKEKKISFKEWAMFYMLLPEPLILNIYPNPFLIFFLAPFFMGFLKTMYDFIFFNNKKNVFNFNFGIKNYFKLLKFNFIYVLFILLLMLIIIWPLTSLVPIKDIKKIEWQLPILYFAYFISSYRFFLLKYIVLENPNLRWKEIIEINKKLAKKDLKIFVYRFSLYIPIILILVWIIYFMKYQVVFSAYEYELIYFLFSPYIQVREIELYKILKSEAIAKGTLTEADFTQK